MDFIRWWVLDNERILSELFPVFVFLAAVGIGLGFLIHVAAGIIILILSVLVLGTVAYVFVERWWKQKQVEFEKYNKKRNDQKPL